MNKPVVSLIVFAAMLVGLHSSVSAQPLSSARVDGPDVPSDLVVPAGHSLFLLGHASGTQNYVCLPAGGSFAWRFQAPQATLFRQSGSGLEHQITTHFLSANPEEGGVLRPTWQHSIDTSRVWGRAVASSTDAAFVAPGAIPWLLLEAVGTAQGPSRGSTLAATTYIQRVNTSGGVAPSTGCAQSSNVGTVALVPYTTDYYFYRASRKH